MSARATKVTPSSGIPQRTPRLRPQTATAKIGSRPATAKPTVTRLADPNPTKTPRRIVTKDEPPARPTTAVPKKNAGLYVEKKRASEKVRNKMNEPFDPTHDYFPEAAKLRKEIQKEFGGKVSDTNPEWLDEMEETRQAINDNFFKSQCIDDSPMVAFDRAASAVIEQMSPNDNIGQVAKKMIDSAFGAIHENLEAQSKLLDERIMLLQKMHHELLEHKCEFTADLDPDDDYDDDLDNAQQFENVLPRIMQRPKTALPRTNKLRKMP